MIIYKFSQSADHLKAEKIWVTKTRAVSSLFAILCVLPLSQIWSYDHFFFQQALGRAQICLTVQQILGNPTAGNVINFTQKIPIFHCQHIT